MLTKWRCSLLQRVDKIPNRVHPPSIYKYFMLAHSTGKSHEMASSQVIYLLSCDSSSQYRSCYCCHFNGLGQRAPSLHFSRCPQLICDASDNTVMYYSQKYLLPTFCETQRVSETTELQATNPLLHVFRPLIRMALASCRTS